MGRAIVNEVHRVELRYLQEEGYLVKGAITTGSLSWTDGASISIKCTYLQGEKHIELTYFLKGEKISYKINITASPSNLGRGEILYFICPKSGRKCRKLYRAYGSILFMSREAYSYKIYYNLQTTSKLMRGSTRYFNLQDRLDKLYNMRATFEHKGRVTKRARLIRKLEYKQKVAEGSRLRELLNFVQKRNNS